MSTDTPQFIALEETDGSVCFVNPANVISLHGNPHRVGGGTTDIQTVADELLITVRGCIEVVKQRLEGN